MNKDAVLATIIGFIIGLCLTVIIVFGPNIFKSFLNIKVPSINLPNKKITINNPKNNAKNTQNDQFSISSPLNDTISDSSDLIVSGFAPESSTIILSSPIEDQIYNTTGKGEFLGKIKLKEGRNNISVSYIKDQKFETKSLNVYYTPVKF